MNTKKILAILTISLFLAGCTKKIPGTTIEKKAGESEKTFTGKMKAAVALGVPFKCTYKNNEVESTGYIKGKKYYTEMITPNGQNTFIIMKDNCMWTWATGVDQGTKMCFEEDIWDMEDQMEGQSETSNDMEYSCTGAVISDSRFDLPSNINFLDLKEQMGAYQQ
jgi:hypothetical protein